VDNADIPVESPNACPMDIFEFGFLKRIIFRKRARTHAGLRKIIKRSWSGRGQAVVTRVRQAGKQRLRLVVNMMGHHIDTINDIHK